MNSSQSTFNEKSGIANTDHHHRRLSTKRAAAAPRGLRSTITIWSATALPTLYLPLLVNGIETVDRLGLFLRLFGLNVFAMVGGRRRHVDP